MTKFEKTGKSTRGQQNEKLLDVLFQHASVRPRAPVEDEANIRAAVHAQWRQVTARRKQKRYLVILAVAASVVLALTLVTILQKPQTPVVDTEKLASLEIQSGEVFVHDINTDNATARRLSKNTLFAGQVLSTNAGARLAMQWKTGESIRLDENSKLALISVSEIELVSGRVYIDTKRSRGAGSAFVIQTFAGPIRHAGTQYLAGIDGETVMLAVREGEVFLSTGHTDILVQKGQMASVGPAGQPDVRPVPTFGQLWAWTSLVTPELSLDGMSVYDLVYWAGRESGRDVEFVDMATQKLAMETGLRGRVNLAPEQALAVILQTSDLEAINIDGGILVRMRTL